LPPVRQLVLPPSRLRLWGPATMVQFARSAVWVRHAVLSQKEFDVAVKPRRDGDAQRRLSDFARNGQGPAGTYPGVDFVEPAGFAKPDQLFGFGR
jgi:hypothetical protein